jgi:hypothetical protein
LNIFQAIINRSLALVAIRLHRINKWKKEEELIRERGGQNLLRNGEDRKL